MQFSVGYSPVRNELIPAIEKNISHISEVYFSFGGFSSGRNMLALNTNLSESELMNRQQEDLDRIASLGVKLNILFNGNCYGEKAQSRELFNKIWDTLKYCNDRYSLSDVTTTSPLIARFVKENFSFINVRASVNMEIGSIEGMDYLAEWFDSFYLKREYNRDIEKIEEIRNWCDKNGKKLYGLANSGCLNFCSARTFHDNLVSHENEIARMDNAYQFEGQCFRYLKSEEKRKKWLSITNFIRPEDIKLYEGLFDGMKLATRVSRDPAKIINAYCKGSFNGAVPSLLEPDHSTLFYPFVIDNKSIDSLFAQKVMNCSKKCDKCGYCNGVQEKATIYLG